jgi:hypothetical protein
MSLVYFITGLPHLAAHDLGDGRPVPIDRRTFARRARETLEGPAREQLELLLLLEEVDETSRVIARATAADPELSAGALAARVRTDRERWALAPSLDTLPDWILLPLPRHVLLRRCYQHFYAHGGPFLRGWARFAVDLEEVLAGLVLQQEDLSADDVAAQMEGHLDSSAAVIARHLQKPDLGLGRRFPWIPSVVEALNHTDRVAGERKLDRLRLSTIDELMGTDLFSVETVLGSYLRLTLLERHASWSAEEGDARLRALLDAPAAPASTQTLGQVSI